MPAFVRKGDVPRTDPVVLARSDVLRYIQVLRLIVGVLSRQALRHDEVDAHVANTIDYLNFLSRLQDIIDGSSKACASNRGTPPRTPSL